MDALYQRAEHLTQRQNLGVSQGMRFDDVVDKYGTNAGLSLDTRGYIEEIAVKELETIFGSAREFNKWYAEISGNEDVRTSFEKFIDFVLDAIEKIKKALKNVKMTKEQRAEYRQTLAEFERIKELYANALKAAESVVTERQQSDAQSNQNLESKTNERYTNSVNYALKDNTRRRSKRSGYSEYNTIGMQWAYSASTKIGDRKVLYKPSIKKYVLAEATKEDVGFIELNSGSFEQMTEERNFYEETKRENERLDRNEETVDKVLRDFGTGQNHNTRNNVDVGNGGKGIQNAEVSEGKSKSNRTADTKTTDGDLNNNSPLKNYSLKDEYWHTDLTKAQVINLVKDLSRVGNPEATRITSTANWYKGRLNGNDLFVIYSTENIGEPTILYERKGAKGKAELEILQKILEVIENGDSVEKQRIIDRVLSGDWVQEKHNMANNNDRPGGRGSDIGYATILQGESSRFNGSKAFRNVLKNIFEIQERISIEDSEGNTLTKEQQEYFKDSKVRNENGNLLVVYHGSASKFTVFSHDKINAHGNSHGRGFYFTEKKSLAEGYNKDGGQLLEGYLNITNPLSEEKVTIKKEDLLKLIEATCKEEAQRLVQDDGYDSVAEALPDTWISNYVDTYNTTLNDAYREVADIIYGNDNDVDIIAELTNAGAGTENVLRLTHDILGYDGVVYTASDGTHEFVSLVSEQFKNVDNTKPTNNPDTRFSLKDSDTNQKLESRVDEGYTDNADYALGEKDTIESIKGLILSINGKRGLKYDGGRVIRIPNNDMETLRHKFMTEHHYSNRSGGLIDCINCFGQGGKKLYFYVVYVGENNSVAPIFRLDYQYLEKYFDVVQKISDEMGYKKDEFIDAASGNGKGIDRIRNIAKGDSIYDVPVTKEGANNTSGEGYNNKGRGGTADNGRSSSGLSDEYDAQGNNGKVKTDFSLKETNDLSTKDQKELLDIIAHLKGEFEVTKFAKADQKQLAKMTRAILKDYSSRADYDTVFKAIDELYTYMANGENGESPIWTDVYNRAYNIAEEIVKKAVEVDDYTYNEYKGLREYLRTTPMKFDSLYDSVPADYENFSEFRKRNFGRLLFTKDGQDKVTRYVTVNL